MKYQLQITGLPELAADLDVPLIVFDGDRSVAFVSTAISDDMGLSLRSLDDFLDLVTGDRPGRESLEAKFQRLTKTGELFRALTTGDPDGDNSHTFEIRATRFKNSGPLYYTAVRLQDLSQEGIPVIELEELQRQATVGHVATGVAHEFNNILTALLGWTQLARRTVNGNTQASSALETIESNTRRAKQIASQLLDIAKPGNDSDQVFSPLETAQEALRLLAWDLKASHITVTSELTSRAACLGNATKMLQVFVNIIRNAMDATPPGGSRQVSVTDDDDHIRIVFSDSGNGIPAGDLDKLFTPYFSTKTRRGDRTGGTGLGLAICKRIVESHCGTITVSSQIPGGTAFTVSLPATDEQMPLTRKEEEVSSTIPPGIAVLVVDDDPDICEMIRTAFSLRGAHVESAVSGEDALEIARREQFHAAFVDFSMTGLSGHDLGRALAQAQPSMPIVFMSGLEIPNEENPYYADFLKKPFDLHEIQCKLREIIDVDRNSSSS